MVSVHAYISPGRRKITISLTTLHPLCLCELEEHFRESPETSIPVSLVLGLCFWIVGSLPLCHCFSGSPALLKIPDQKTPKVRDP